MLSVAFHRSAFMIRVRGVLVRFSEDVLTNAPDKQMASLFCA